jgi:hypothetical protein
MRVRRVLVPDSTVESWTLLGEDLAPVEPVERFDRRSKITWCDELMRQSGDKDDDLRRVTPVGEQSSGRMSGPFTDFSLPLELRCWFILSSVRATRQHSMARLRASRPTPACPRPGCMTLTCYDASP